MDFKSLRVAFALLLPLLWVEGVWASDCASDSYHLRSAEEFEELLATGCDRITGRLTISAQSVTRNLRGLDNITSIGWLTIEGTRGLTHLDGLAKLNRVEHSIDIEGNPFLVNLDGLASLESVGTHLNIVRNAALMNLDGLTNLKSVALLRIEENDA